MKQSLFQLIHCNIFSRLTHSLLKLFVVVVFVFQGQKGAPGSPAKPPHGAIKFSDTADNCTLRTAGTVRYSTSQNALQLCDGRAWLPLVTAGKGHVANNPGLHCLDILNTGEFQMEQQRWKSSTQSKIISKKLSAIKSFLYFNVKIYFSFQVRVVVTDYTGSTQTVAPQMTRSKPFATWTLSVEVGP